MSSLISQPIINSSPLHELFATATHEASAAMSRWTNGLVTLSLDDVIEVDLCEAFERLAVGGDLLTAVVLRLEGDLGGDIVLLFDEQNGREMAKMLLRRSVDATGPLSPLEVSALQETGNILACAYLNALTRLVATDLVPSTPYFLQDYGASVLEQSLMAQAMTSDRLVICRTGFHRDGADLNWNVFFLPSQGLRDALQRVLHVGEGTN